MKTNFYLLLILSACLMYGCKNGGGGKPDFGTIELGRVDLPSAQALFVAGNASTRAVMTSAEGEDGPDWDMAEPKLFQVTETGDSYEVSFLDQDNEVIPVETQGFVNLLGEYVLLRVRYINLKGEDVNYDTVPLGNIIIKHVLIDLKDGSIYVSDIYEATEGALHTLYNCAMAGWFSDPYWLVKNDRHGSVYFMDSGLLYKISRSGGGIRITSTELPLHANGVIWLFNYNGDIWFDDSNFPYGEDFYDYCVTSGGEIIESSYWLDPHMTYTKKSVPGSFFSIDNESVPGEDGIHIGFRLTIYKYTPGATELERTIEFESETLYEYQILPGLMPLAFVKDRLVAATDHIFVIDDDYNVVTYDNTTNQFPRDPGYFPNDLSKVSDNYVYDRAETVVTGSVFRRLDVETGEVSVFYTFPSGYRFESWQVSEDDLMTIRATVADGSPVTIIVEPDGTATEHKTFGDQTIYQYEVL